MFNKNEKFSLRGRWRSVLYACSGLREVLKTEHNTWIHMVFTVLVIALGIVLDVSVVEWCLLVFAITGVWVAELLNTAFEQLCDVASPEFHPQVKRAKDIAAGAVLMSALGSATMGLIIFIPYLVKYV